MIKPLGEYEKELLTYEARQNLRGYPSKTLVIEAQNIAEELAALEACPELITLIIPWADIEEKQSNLIEVWRCSGFLRIEAIRAELLRRENWRTDEKSADRPTIRAIKELLGEQGLIEVLGWYCKVFIEKRSWTFQCTLHGADTTPSGAIYPKELRWWCYGCGKGGDVFDAVMAFERVDLGKAIVKLARHLGMETHLPRSREPVYRKWLEKG